MQWTEQFFQHSWHSETKARYEVDSLEATSFQPSNLQAINPRKFCIILALTASEIPRGG